MLIVSMAPSRMNPAVHETARIALVETLEQMRSHSTLYADNMTKLSTDSGRSGPVYGMFLKGKTRLSADTVKRICINLKASRRQARAVSFLLAAWKWEDEEVAEALLLMSGADVPRLVKAAEIRAEATRRREAVSGLREDAARALPHQPVDPLRRRLAVRASAHSLAAWWMLNTMV